MIRVTRLVEQRFPLPDADGGETPAAADSRRVWRERLTLLVVIEDGDGRVGLGEAAPLPDYSPDSLEDAWSSLVPLVDAPLGADDLGAPGSSRALRAVTEAIASPAARFALESALLDLWSRRRGEPAWALLARVGHELSGAPGARNTAAADGLPVATLLPSGTDLALSHAERAISRGIHCFKAKTGAPGAWSDELATFRALRRRFPGTRLRVDANQALSPAELWQRLPAFRELELEWLEEPIADFPDGIEWNVGVPLALDESLRRGAPSPAVVRDHGVRAYVLKPTTLGGYLRSFELAFGAAGTGVDVVLSHTYEGPVGFSAVAALSLALGPNRPPDGLDRHAGVADAPELPAFDSVRGRVRAWNEPGFGLSLAPLLERRKVTREARA